MPRIKVSYGIMNDHVLLSPKLTLSSTLSYDELLPICLMEVEPAPRFLSVLSPLFTKIFISNCSRQKKWTGWMILDLRIRLSERGPMTGANSERAQREAERRSGRTERRVSWAALPGDGGAAYSERNPPTRPTSDCPPLAPNMRSTRSVPSPDPAHIIQEFLKMSMYEYMYVQ